MPDVDAIHAANTEYREGFNQADVARVLSVYAQGFVDMSAGQPTFYGSDARTALEARLKELFLNNSARMAWATVNTVVLGDQALEHGWQKIWLTPRNGEEKLIRLRYCKRWMKQLDGEWKIAFIITNKDEEPAMGPSPESERMRTLAVRG